MIIKIEVKNKIARVINPKCYIVCGNSDYVIKFEFDDEWAEFEVKTARFSYGGKYIDVVFSGDECAVPVLTNTHTVTVGVFAGDLRTTTPAVVTCRKSILCEKGAPFDPPDDVYNQIMALLNNGGGNGEGAKEIVVVDVLSIVNEQKVQDFLELSRRASLGEILIMGKLTTNSGNKLGIIQGIHYDDSGERAVANWSLVSSVWYGITDNMSLQNVEIEVYGLECDGETIAFGMGSPSMGDIATAKEQLTNPYDEWTAEEQAKACETIGAVPKIDNKSGQNRAYVRTHDNENASVAIYYASTYNTQADWLKIGGGLPSYVNGELGCATPTGDYRTANKKYVDDNFLAKPTSFSGIGIMQYNPTVGGVQRVATYQSLPSTSGNQIPISKGGGRIVTNTPVDELDCTNKKYVDEKVSELLARIEALENK